MEVLRVESERFFVRLGRRDPGIPGVFRGFGKAELAEKIRSRRGMTFASGCWQRLFIESSEFMPTRTNRPPNSFTRWPLPRLLRRPICIRALPAMRNARHHAPPLPHRERRPAALQRSPGRSRARARDRGRRLVRPTKRCATGGATSRTSRQSPLHPLPQRGWKKPEAADGHRHSPADSGRGPGKRTGRRKRTQPIQRSQGAFGQLSGSRGSRGRRTDDTLAFLHQCFEDDVVRVPRTEVPLPAAPGASAHLRGRRRRARTRRHRPLRDGWMPMMIAPEKLATDRRRACASSRRRAAGSRASGGRRLHRLRPARPPRAAAQVAGRCCDAGATRLVAGARYDDADGFRRHDRLPGGSRARRADSPVRSGRRLLPC